MLEEFMNVMTDENVKRVENEELNAEVKNLIEGLELFSGNPKLLTNAYTDILMNDNVVYLITRISQNSILGEIFPELYIQNDFGESVINCQQNSPYHRYGVFRHILYTVEYVGKDNLKYSKHDLKLLKWTMFLHDIGKPYVKTTNAEGKDSFAGHDDLSVEMAEKILNRFDFVEEDKKIILTLIKYHDRYLNEGELTQDNLEFLAQELEEKKELFEFLIEVKTADNKAKSIEVYNKFLTVLPKYEEFAANHFKNIKAQSDVVIPAGLDLEEPVLSDEEIIGSELNKLEIAEDIKKKIKITKKGKRLSDDEFNKIYDCIINDENINYYYAPIVDMENKSIFAYEVEFEFETGEDVDKVFLKAREEGKYDKIGQLLFVNQVNSALKEKKDIDTAVLIKMDISSFNDYNNKNRIYDIMDKDNVIISFQNYDEFNIDIINNLYKEITKRHGMVSLSNFESSKYTAKELEDMEVDFVEFDLNVNTDDGKLHSIMNACEKDTKRIILKNINNKNELAKIKNINVTLVQGDCLFERSERMEVTEYEVERAFD